MLKSGFLSSVLFLFLITRTEAQDFFTPALSSADMKKMGLRSINGKKAEIKFTQSPLTLFVLLSPECPLCKNYSVVLNNLQKEYEENLQMFGLVPGKAYSSEDVQQFTSDYAIQFPILFDSEKRFSTYVQATVTPEVILTNRNGAVIYRGAIDDWVPELGKKKLKAEQHYLKDAINQYLHGQPVSIKQTIAKGCLINEF